MAVWPTPRVPPMPGAKVERRPWAVAGSKRYGAATVRDGAVISLDPAQGVRFHFDFGQLSWSRCAESESATIHLNPVKHGLVAAPKAWPHSSFAEWVARDVYEPTWGSGEMPELPVWAKLAE